MLRQIVVTGLVFLLSVQSASNAGEPETREDRPFNSAPEFPSFDSSPLPNQFLKPEAPSKKLLPLGYWLERLGSVDPAVRNEAKKSIREHDDVNYLSWPRELSGSDESQELSRIRNEIKPLRCQLLALLESSDPEIREHAIFALPYLGDDAAIARPALLRIIKSKSSRNESVLEAAIVLFYITPRGTPVAPEIWTALCESNFEIPVDKSISSEEQVHRDAFSADFGAIIFTNVLAETDRTMIEIPVMAQAARTTTLPRVLRLFLLHTFIYLEAEARAPVPVLNELLSDKDELIRVLAAHALIAQEDNPRKAQTLIRSLSISEQLRSRLEKSVNEILKERASTLEWLRELVQDKEELARWRIMPTSETTPSARRQIFRQLGQLGADAKPVVPELLLALKNGDAYTREVVLDALKRIDPSSIPQSAMIVCGNAPSIASASCFIQQCGPPCARRRDIRQNSRRCRAKRLR